MFVVVLSSCFSLWFHFWPVTNYCSSLSFHQLTADTFLHSIESSCSFLVSTEWLTITAAIAGGIVILNYNFQPELWEKPCCFSQLLSYRIKGWKKMKVPKIMRHFRSRQSRCVYICNMSNKIIHGTVTWVIRLKKSSHRDQYLPFK